MLLLRGIRTPTQCLVTDKKSPTTGWRAVNILNKPAILCYSSYPPTTDISGGFLFNKTGDSMSLFKLEYIGQEDAQTRRRCEILKELVASYKVEPDVTLTDIQQHLRIVQKEIKTMIKSEKRKKKQ